MRLCVCVDYIHLAQDGDNLTSPCKHCNEPLTSIKFI